MNRIKKLRLVEFLIIGVVMGTLEDLIAVFAATDAKFSWNVLIVVFLVALPFAFISEIVVDHPNFWKRIWPAIGSEVAQARREIKREGKAVEEEIERIV